MRLSLQIRVRIRGTGVGVMYDCIVNSVPITSDIAEDDGVLAIVQKFEGIHRFSSQLQMV